MPLAGRPARVGAAVAGVGETIPTASADRFRAAAAPPPQKNGRRRRPPLIPQPLVERFRGVVVAASSSSFQTRLQPVDPQLQMFPKKKKKRGKEFRRPKGSSSEVGSGADGGDTVRPGTAGPTGLGHPHAETTLNEALKQHPGARRSTPLSRPPISTGQSALARLFVSNPDPPTDHRH